MPLNSTEESDDARLRDLLCRAHRLHGFLLNGFKLSRAELETLERVHGLLLGYFHLRKDLFPGTVQALEAEREWMQQKLKAR